jgi:hypothetical protein
MTSNPEIWSPAIAGDNESGCSVEVVAALQTNLIRLRYACAEVELESKLISIGSEVRGRPPAVHRWPRGQNGLLEIPSVSLLKRSVAFLRIQLAADRIAYRERKGGYNEDEPRVPQRQTGGGEWTDGGGGSTKPAASADNNGGSRPRIFIYVPTKDEGGGGGATDDSDSDGPQIGEPPEVPIEEFPTKRALYQFTKEATLWLTKAALKEISNPLIGTFLNAIEAGRIAYKAYPYIKAYFDPPKPLNELQQNASNPATGYDIHHIVEQASAEKSGYPRQMIDAPENLVRIPTLKHWEINAWYSRYNRDFGSRSPRDYLRDKNWTERIRVGHYALVKYGVLLP